MTVPAHKQSIITEFLNQSENREEKVRADELRKKIGVQKNKAKNLLALYDETDDMVLSAYKQAKKTLDMMEAELIDLNKNDYSAINKDILEAFIDSFITEVGVSDVFLKKFFDSLDVKVIVNNKNAEIQLNLSVLPFVVALKGIEPLISP